MPYDWRTLVPDGLNGTPEVAAFLDQRVSEMSPKEWRIFTAALQMNPQADLAGVAAITYSLECFNFYYPACDDTSLGQLLAEFNYGARSDIMEYLDFAIVAERYRGDNKGMFVDGAYVGQCTPSELERIKMKAESIGQFGILPADEGWSAKLHICGPDGSEVWLRLPDYQEVNGGQADEVTVALDDLGVATLDDCTLLEARCFHPQIDLTEYSNLQKLVFDASNLQFGKDEYQQHDPGFEQKLQAALTYENCQSMNFAIDIIANLNCYDFISTSDVVQDIVNSLPAVQLQQPQIMDAFDINAFATDHFKDQGMIEVEGGFIKRNGNSFRYDYSKEPSQREMEAERAGLEKQLGQELDRCMSEFLAEAYCWSPERLIAEAHKIAATDIAYNGFHSDAHFSIETMKTLLCFENPLEVLRDAWSEHADAGLINHIDEYLKMVRDDPVSQKNYAMVPEEPDQQDFTVQVQEMG